MNVRFPVTIPFEMGARIHAIMDGISKTSLKLQRFAFSVQIKPTLIYFISANIKKIISPKGVVYFSGHDTAFFYIFGCKTLKD